MADAVRHLFKDETGTSLRGVPLLWDDEVTCPVIW